jgi:hypothetical protein
MLSKSIARCFALATRAWIRARCAVRGSGNVEVHARERAWSK